MIALLTPLLYSLGPAALLLVMAVVFAESGLLFGFFLPGDSLLFLAGALVASHVIGLPIWALAAGVLVAAVIGDQVGYVIGRRFGPRLFSRADSRLFSHANAHRAERFFARHGPRAVILARFIPVVRTFVPATAGIGAMDRRRFTTYNVIGAAVWSVGIVAAGFFFGGIPFVAHHIELITIGVAACSIVPALLALAKRRSARPATASKRTADSSAEPAPDHLTSAGS
jgi:membrane-associated protein